MPELKYTLGQTGKKIWISTTMTIVISFYTGIRPKLVMVRVSIQVRQKNK